MENCLPETQSLLIASDFSSRALILLPHYESRTLSLAVWGLSTQTDHSLRNSNTDFTSALHPGRCWSDCEKPQKNKKKGTQSSGIESRCLVWMLHCRRTKQTRTWASNLTSGFCAGEPRHLLDSSPLVSVVRFCLKHHQLVRFSGVVTYFQLTAITAILKFLISQWAPLISSWLFPSRLH